MYIITILRVDKLPLKIKFIHLFWGGVLLGAGPIQSIHFNFFSHFRGAAKCHPKINEQSFV